MRNCSSGAGSRGPVNVVKRWTTGHLQSSIDPLWLPQSLGLSKWFLFNSSNLEQYVVNNVFLFFDNWLGDTAITKLATNCYFIGWWISKLWGLQLALGFNWFPQNHQLIISLYGKPRYWLTCGQIPLQRLGTVGLVLIYSSCCKQRACIHHWLY